MVGECFGGDSCRLKVLYETVENCRGCFGRVEMGDEW